MEIIKKWEEKEALRTKPGYSQESYASIAARTMNLNTHEATDRRIVFELTGHKLDVNGHFIDDDDETIGEKKVDPSTETHPKTEDIIIPLARKRASTLLIKPKKKSMLLLNDSDDEY